jgi:hypothetical protein
LRTCSRKVKSAMSLRKAILFAIAAIVLLVAARFYISGHQAPAGQPPLGELNNDSLKALKNDFNLNSDRVRVILLLSPT